MLARGSGGKGNAQMKPLSPKHRQESDWERSKWGYNASGGVSDQGVWEREPA